VPSVVARCLTQTLNEEWLIWAAKIAWVDGTKFRALCGDSYPADARAECLLRRDHVAPDPSCTCGFHAVSHSEGLSPFAARLVARFSTTIGASRSRQPTRLIGTDAMMPAELTVVLSGRVLTFQWSGDAVLFRAERQTVVSVRRPGESATGPDDPTGVLSRVVPREPIGVGPVRLALPREAPPTVPISDDAGYCIMPTAPHPLSRQRPAFSAI
jgi:hypothetical protein